MVCRDITIRGFIIFITSCFAIGLGLLNVANASADVPQARGFQEGDVRGFDRGDRRHRIVSEKGGILPRKSTKHVRYGRDSFLVEIAGSINGVSSSSYKKNRSEIFIIKQERLEREHWIQFSMFVPKNFIYPDNWFLFFQSWQVNAENPILVLGVAKSGEMGIFIRNDDYPKGKSLRVYQDKEPLAKGVWHDFVIVFKGDLNQNGELFVWRRLGSKDSCFVKLVGGSGVSIGKSVYPSTGRLIKQSDLQIIPRVGIYRGGSDIPHQLWFDGLKYGKAIILNNLDAKCVE